MSIRDAKPEPAAESQARTSRDGQAPGSVSDPEAAAAEKANPANDDDDETDLYKPKTFAFWAVIVSALLSMFLVALDRTIIATAVPRITDEFHSQGDIGWYAAGYNLPAAVAMLGFGKIYKYYDLKW